MRGRNGSREEIYAPGQIEQGVLSKTKKVERVLRTRSFRVFHLSASGRRAPPFLAAARASIWATRLTFPARASPRRFWREEAAGQRDAKERIGEWVGIRLCRVRESPGS